MHNDSAGPSLHTNYYTKAAQCVLLLCDNVFMSHPEAHK